MAASHNYTRAERDRETTLLPHVTLGQLLGALDLYNLGLSTPEHALESLLAIAQGYRDEKAKEVTQ